MKKWFNMLSKLCTLKVYPEGRKERERREKGKRRRGKRKMGRG